MLIIYCCYNYLVKYNNLKNIIDFIIYLFNYNKWKKDYFLKIIYELISVLLFLYKMKKSKFNNSINKIKIIPYSNSILISIHSNFNNSYESKFNLEYLNKFKLFQNNTIQEIYKLISFFIIHNNFKIKTDKNKLKLIFIPIIPKSNNIELILYQNNKIQLTNCNFKLIKTINVHNSWINSIGIFPSGNMISVSGDSSIKIFNINYSIIQKIENANNDDIKYVCIKDENNFITCSCDKTIKIWNKKNSNEFKLNKIIYNAHNNWINSVLYYSNNIISCSLDGTVKIWGENKYNYELITILKHNNWIYSLLLIDNQNLLISSGLDGTKLWNINNYELIKYFEDVKCERWNALCKINENMIIVGYNNLLNVISLNERKIIHQIPLSIDCFAVKSIIKNGIFFLGGLSNDIMIYRCDNFKCIQIIKNANDDFSINGFVELKNGCIVTFVRDKTIKILSF